jgi:AcrR family transcriptional regulator
MTRHARERPYGAEAVRKAVITAAIDLFAHQGPAAVSIRQIAAHAGVNHGLVHRHFGSKQALLTLVLDELSSELAASDLTLGSDRDGAWSRAFRATRNQNAYWRILGHLMLEGQPLSELQPNFPLIRRMVASTVARQSEGRIDPSLDPRAVTAIGAAFSLGWLMFAPFALVATGLTDLPQAQRNGKLANVWRKMRGGLRPPP